MAVNETDKAKSKATDTKPKHSKSRGMSPQQIRKKVFKRHSMEGKWEQFLGIPEHNFHSMIVGMEGQGKSSFAALYAAYLEKFGKVCYFSAEEGISLSLQERLIQLGIEDTKRLFFYVSRDKREIQRIITNSKPKFIFIDSADEINLSPEELQDWKVLFKRKKSWHTIHKGVPPRGSKWGFDTDIKIELINLVAHTRKNRFKKLGSFPLERKDVEQLVLNLNS